MTQTHELEKSVNIGKARVRKGIIFKRKADPTNSMISAINSYFDGEKKEITDLISKNFEIVEGEYTKYEFLWLPERAAYPGETKYFFEMQNCSLTTLLTKERSLIFIIKTYRFEVGKQGCGGTGPIRAIPSSSWQMEEIYYNKITTVSATHSENTFRIINDGCFASESDFTVSHDGFVVRAGENFSIFASEKFASELASARSFINQKISEAN